MNTLTFPTLPNKLQKIGTLSPSNAGSAIINDGCQFRLLIQSWNNRYDPIKNPNGIGKMLPDSGANIFGNIMHEIFNRANRIDLDNIFGPWPGAFDVWDRLVEKNEEALKKDPINAHLIPIKHIKDYLFRRGCICRRAENIRKNAQPNGDRGHSDLRLKGSEVLVQDRLDNPQISGKIDLIYDNGTEMEILDWKTGNIIDDDGGIKLEYKVQLQLYAALIERKQIDVGESPVRFPSKAILENPETGKVITLEKPDLEPNVCRQILDKAIEIHRKINNAVAKDDDSKTLMENLTIPNIKGCRYCPIRPACTKYLSEFVNWMKDVTEDNEDIAIQDVTGEFLSLDKSGPRSPIGTIIIRDSSNREWRVAGVDFEAKRNLKAIDNLRLGNKVSVFNIYTNSNCKLLGYIHIKANPRTHIVYSSN